jgi:hypothetical protein
MEIRSVGGAAAWNKNKQPFVFARRCCLLVLGTLDAVVGEIDCSKT